eukprot:4635025-Pyramimonas_sp.AAC.1
MIIISIIISIIIISASSSFFANDVRANRKEIIVHITSQEMRGSSQRAVTLECCSERRHQGADHSECQAAWAKL